MFFDFIGSLSWLSTPAKRAGSFCAPDWRVVMRSTDLFAFHAGRKARFVRPIFRMAATPRRAPTTLLQNPFGLQASNMCARTEAS
jgi:hypothetical protein